MPEQELISKRQLQLLQLADEIQASDDESVNASYASRIMAQLSLPYRNPGDVTEWVRRNNALTLTITPGVITTPQGRQRGYPYGVIPRYLLTWMTTEAIKTRSRELELGGSLAAFMRQLGLSSTGMNAKRLMEQTQRLAVASMNIEDIRTQENRWGIQGANFHIASKYDLWFRKTDIDQEQLLPSSITLSEEFYQDAITAPVKLRPEVLKQFSGSPMRLDMYTWLTYRLRRLKRPSTVTWGQLIEQFGADYKAPRQFKAAFIKHLHEVILFLPENSCTVQPSGIRLNRTVRGDQQLAS